MTNTEFIVRENGGLNHLAPERHRAGTTSFGIVDIALGIGFIVAFMGLILLLAK